MRILSANLLTADWRLCCQQSSRSVGPDGTSSTSDSVRNLWRISEHYREELHEYWRFGGDGRVNNPRQYSISRGFGIHPPFIPRRCGCRLHPFAPSPEACQAFLQSGARRCKRVHGMLWSNPREISPVTHSLPTHGPGCAERSHFFLAEHDRTSPLPKTGR